MLLFKFCIIDLKRLAVSCTFPQILGLRKSLLCISSTEISTKSLFVVACYKVFSVSFPPHMFSLLGLHLQDLRTYMAKIYYLTVLEGQEIKDHDVGKVDSF